MLQKKIFIIDCIGEKIILNLGNNFKNFCSFANENNIEIIAGISPGLDFNFSSIKNNFNLSDDFDKLISKFQALIDNGANRSIV